jgi:hypothetical protein
MSRRDASLQAIQAEIHKCRDELMFLGCGDHGSEPKCADALNRISVRLDTMAAKLSEDPLRTFLEGIKPLLLQVMTVSRNGVVSMEYLHDAYHNYFKIDLDILKKQHPDAAFTDKIAEIETQIFTATNGPHDSADHYLQCILHNIGKYMLQNHHQFNYEPWLSPVADDIPVLSGMLQNA